METSFLELVLVGLVTWRLAFLLVMDDGPWNVIQVFRDWAMERPVPILGGAIACIGCLSLWMAPVALLVVRETPEQVALVLSAWSLSTMANRALS
jgi:hypothetical protein